jgi:hypothetical protein
MICGGTSTSALDSSLTTVKYAGKSQIKNDIEKLQKDLEPWDNGW